MDSQRPAVVTLCLIQISPQGGNTTETDESTSNIVAVWRRFLLDGQLLFTVLHRLGKISLGECDITKAHEGKSNIAALRHRLLLNGQRSLIVIHCRGQISLGECDVTQSTQAECHID